MEKTRLFSRLFRSRLSQKSQFKNKSKMIQELESIVLTEDIPDLKLVKVISERLSSSIFSLQIRRIREMEIANARTLD